MALVTCPCAFRLCTLAQNDGRVGRVRHFPCTFHTKWLWWHVHVHFHCAGPRKNETSHTKILPRGRLSRDFAKRPLLEILFRDLAKRPLTEIFPTELLERSCTRSCQETSHSDLVQRPGEESSGLPGRSCIDSLNRDLTLTSLRDLLWRSLIERSLQEYWQETSYRDHHVQRSWQNTSFGDLAQRNCRDICWDLAKRPPTEIFQTELL